MDSHATLVLKELLVALRANHANVDLRTGAGGTPRVVIADGGAPPVKPPFMVLSVPRVPIDIDRAALTQYHNAGELEWYAWVAATELTTEARGYAGLNLADDIVTAVQNAHRDPAFTTLYTVQTLIAWHDDVWCDGPGLPPGQAQVHGFIRYETDLERGV